ncbi:MAG: hypothetical protein ACK5XS_09645 [Armatimonadota bacterium]|jgi:hypothetical protein|nr:hypothetical protein [Fimbriimonadaceae bacterium]MCZ8138699.1 hypothetical protein [Fimbriimonadaceae bacterium]
MGFKQRIEGAEADLKVAEDFKKTAQREAWQFIRMVLVVGLCLVAALYIASYTRLVQQPSDWGSMADFVAGTFGVAAGIAGAYVVIRLANQALTSSHQQNALASKQNELVIIQNALASKQNELVTIQNELAESQKRRDDYIILNGEINSALEKILSLASSIQSLASSISSTELAGSIASEQDNRIRELILHHLKTEFQIELDSLNDISPDQLAIAKSVPILKSLLEDLQNIGINGRFPYLFDKTIVANNILPSLDGVILSLSEVLHDARASALLLECIDVSTPRFASLLDQAREIDRSLFGWNAQDPFAILSTLQLKANSYRIEVKSSMTEKLDFAVYHTWGKRLSAEQQNTSVSKKKPWLDFWQQEAFFRFGLLMWHRTTSNGNHIINLGGLLLLSMIDILPEPEELRTAVGRLYGNVISNESLLSTLPIFAILERRGSLLPADLLKALSSTNVLEEAVILRTEALSETLEELQGMHP